MPDSSSQIKTERLPLNRAIISDILLWLALVLLLAYGVYFFGVALPAKRGQEITLNFHNANEISKGSPVRMMGTDIGFVSDVHMRHDHVEVTVQTFPGTMKIPSGATFDILFTGLGGAKSVEVVTPDIPQPTINGKPVYLVQEPISMRDVLNASIDVTQALQKGAENITDFFGKKKPVEELQFNIRQVHSMSNTAVRNTDTLNQSISEIHQAAQENIHPATDTLNQLRPGVAYAASVTNPITARPELIRFFQSIQKLSQVLNGQESGAMRTVALQQRLTQLNQLNSQVSQRTQNLSTRLTNAPISQWLQGTSNNKGINHFSATLDRATLVTSKDYTPALQHAHQSIRKFNQHLVQIKTKIAQPPVPPAQPNP